MADMSRPVDDRARFEWLFDAHVRAVRAYALRRTDAATAEDVVADTFLVCWRRLDDVPGDALPWLYGVARRALANRRRGARRADAALRRRGDEPVPPAPEPDGAGRDPRARAALEAALASVPHPDRLRAADADADTGGGDPPVDGERHADSAPVTRHGAPAMDVIWQAHLHRGQDGGSSRQGPPGGSR